MLIAIVADAYELRSVKKYLLSCIDIQTKYYNLVNYQIKIKIIKFKCY